MCLQLVWFGCISCYSIVSSNKTFTFINQDWELNIVQTLIRVLPFPPLTIDCREGGGQVKLYKQGVQVGGIKCLGICFIKKWRKTFLIVTCNLAFAHVFVIALASSFITQAILVDQIYIVHCTCTCILYVQLTLYVFAVCKTNLVYV